MLGISWLLFGIGVMDREAVLYCYGGFSEKIEMWMWIYSVKIGVTWAADK